MMRGRRPAKMIEPIKQALSTLKVARPRTKLQLTQSQTNRTSRDAAHDTYHRAPGA